MRTARINLIDSVADAISWSGFATGSYAICTGNADSRYIKGRNPAPSKIQVYLHQRIPTYYSRAFGSDHTVTFPYENNFHVLDKYVGLNEFNHTMREAFLASFNDGADGSDGSDGSD
jgi:hypothetical protein